MATAKLATKLICLGHGAQKARHLLSPGMLHPESDVFAQGTGGVLCGGAGVSWLGRAALSVSAPLEHHVCPGKTQHPSGSNRSRAKSVCTKPALPLGTRISAHCGPHTVHRYSYGRVNLCVIAAKRAVQVNALSLNEQLPCCTVRSGERTGTCWAEVGI